MAVLLIQCRKPQEAKRSDQVMRVQRLIRRELGIEATIELVPRHTLPRTTFGKLSRSQARQDYINRMCRTPAIQVGREYDNSQFLRQAV